MLRKKQINNYFSKNLKKKFIQYETKKYLLRSIIQNQKIKPYIRAYAFFKLTKLRQNTSISKQFNWLALHCVWNTFPKSTKKADLTRLRSFRKGSGNNSSALPSIKTLPPNGAARRFCWKVWKSRRPVSGSRR